MIRNAGRHVVTVALLLAVAAAPAAAVPNPTVTGPIPQNAPPGDPSHDYTFFSSPLLADGYVEQEFFIEGTANAYDTPPLTTATVVSSDHAYRTRIVVRRPADPKRFNGTVILEWLNVTAGFDIDSWLSGVADHLMREGYAWVGVSAQRAGIHAPGSGLKSWSPTRYGTLDVTDGGILVADELCYDIYSQAGQAVMHPVGTDPLGGLQPERILAFGVSQSAFRLGIYYNSVQPLANLFEGFFLYGSNPTARLDLGVPVFKLHSETDAAIVASGIGPGGPVPPLQADSDVVRTWQVAGTSHFDGFNIDNLFAVAGRDGILLPPLGLCANPEGSRVPLYHVFNAVYGHMVRWIKDGTLPPTAPLIETAGTAIGRDARGLALGGIRLAAVEAPIALNTGINVGPFFCGLLGTHEPYDQETLATLYPDHGTYVDAIQAAVDGNMAAGFITQRDAQATITKAAMSNIGSSSARSLDPEASLRVATARLEQNFPNPFAPSTEIRYAIRKAGRVQLTIYNIAGQRVCRLVDRMASPGEYRVTWPGTDDRNRPLPNGIYLYRLTTPDFDEARKLMIKR